MSIHGTHVQMHFVVRPQESPLLHSENDQTNRTSSFIDEAAALNTSGDAIANVHRRNSGDKKQKNVELKMTNGKSTGSSASDVKSVSSGCCADNLLWIRSVCSSVLLLLASIFQLCLIEREWLIKQVPLLIHLPMYSWYTNATQLLDPLFGMLSVLIIGALIYPDMKQSGLILLQTMPASLDLQHLRRQLLKQCPAVLGIHELHVWCLTPSTTIATCHLLLMQQFPSRAAYDEFINQVNQVFGRQGISRVTVQPEFLRDLDGNLTDSLNLSATLPVDSQQHLLRMRLEQNESSDHCLFPCPANTGDCAQKVCCHRKDEEGHCSQMSV
jgi:hypothetical protein